MKAEDKKIFYEIQEFLIDHLGLKKENLKESQWESIVIEFLKKTGFSSMSELMRALKWNEKLLQQLVESIVVPETWFFREKESIVFVAEQFRAKKHFEPYRILSLPCSSGEEPYSIAIALFDKGISAKDFEIDAADISQIALAKGEKALYEAHSFRHEGGDSKERWFESSGKLLYPPAFIRDQVHFFHVNIADPRAFLPRSSYDAIFLRHLLIYLSEKIAGLLLRKCWDLLKPGGFFVVGAVEAELARKFGFAPVIQSGIPVFTKSKKPALARLS